MKGKTKTTHMKKQLILLYITAIGITANAQPFNLDEKVKPVELTFKDHFKEGETKPIGRISINPITQENDTAYYYIGGISMYAPTYFSINTTDTGADLKVSLFKENWREAHKTGEVKEKNIWKTSFKTEGDFGIRVITGKKPGKYVLLVFSGNDLEVQLPSVFNKGNGNAGGAANGWFKKNMLTVIIGAVALLAILFLLFKLKKKKNDK
jgi:hypothetical protein